MFGTAFDVDGFLAASTLAPCKVWHPGARVRAGRPAITTAGFNVTVSEADDLPAQVADAVAFLGHHHADLRRLSDRPDVGGLVLDFGVPRRDAPGQFDALPAALVRAAGELRMSIELSRYAVEPAGDAPPPV